MDQPDGSQMYETPDGRVISRLRFLELGTGAIVATALGGALAPTRAVAGELQTGTLKWAPDNPPTNFDSAIAARIASLVAVNHIFESLSVANPRGGADPLMIDGPPKRIGPRQMAVTLKRGLRFHDGSPVTAADVAFTYNRHIDRRTGSLLRPGVEPIRSVRAEGARRVVFNMRRQSDYFSTTLALYKIISAAAYARMGQQEYSLRPIGSGVFRLAELTPPTGYRLEQFAGYRGSQRRPLLAGIECTGVTDAASRISQLRTDAFHVIDHVPVLDVGAVTGAGLRVGTALGSAQLSMEFEHSKPPFNDVRVRRAFMHAIDRGALSRAVTNGRARPAYSMLPERSPYFVDPKTKPSYDPDKARDLLRKAGHRSGVDFEMLVHSNNLWAPPVSQVMQEQLRAVGFRAQLRLLTGGAAYTLAAQGNYQCFLVYYNIGLFSDPVDFFYRFATYGGNRQAFYRWQNASAIRYDQLVNRAYMSRSFEERKARYADAQEILNTAVPGAVPILYMPVISAWQPEVRGFAPSGTDLSDFRRVSLA